MPLSFHGVTRDVKGFLNRFNSRELLSYVHKEKPRLAGGSEPGRGTPEGGRRKAKFELVANGFVASGQDADFLQFGVREKGFFNIAGAFTKAESGFLGDTANFFSRYSQQIGGSSASYVFRDFVFHEYSPSGSIHCQSVFFHTQNHGLIDIDVPAFANPHPHCVAVLF